MKAHEKDLRRVLDVLDRHEMVCKPTKASSFAKEVEIEGHAVAHWQRIPMPDMWQLWQIQSNPPPSASFGHSRDCAIFFRVT